MRKKALNLIIGTIRRVQLCLTMIPSTIIALVVHVAAALSCLADGRAGLYSVIETPHNYNS